MKKPNGKKCPQCDGKGKVILWLGIRPKTITVMCGKCGGTGRIASYGVTEAVDGDAKV